jgi:hypothetical protein
LLLQAGAVCSGVGGVQLDEHLARLNSVAIFDQHAFDDTRFEWLQGLGALADNDSA